ncbi:MAG: hypothetical protein B6D46_04370 [Polyangiaceae bacterium UTPRO1]|jgi:hypothetical protein|nr:MAG: hypothetical protein B6D46_04370 [Polyangiaceae bacterium UTPRO1]
MKRARKAGSGLERSEPRALVEWCSGQARSHDAAPVRGLIIAEPYIGWILAGKKIWELRGRKTNIRGPIALIAKGTGTVVGTCEFVDVLGPLSVAELRDNAARLNKRREEITGPHYYGDHTYAWVLTRARRLPVPVPYNHPVGAIIWVKLESAVVSQLRWKSSAPR